MTSAGFKDVPQFEIVQPDKRMIAKARAEKLRRARAADADLAITPGGRPGDASSLAKPGYKGKRKLSDYEREVAHALIRKGHSKSRAIAMARGIIRNAATLGKWGQGRVRNPAVAAGAVASIAQRKSFANKPADDVDLVFGRSQKVAVAKAVAASRKRRTGSIPVGRRKSASKVSRGVSDPFDHIWDDASTKDVFKIFQGVATKKQRAREKADLNRARHEGKSGKSRVGKVYRYKHGWIPVASLAEAEGIFFDLSNAVEEFDLDLAGHWKHGYIPLDAEAMEIKLHHKKGSGPSSGVKNPMVSHTRYHSAKTKESLPKTTLKAHARAHTAAATRARTPESKAKHLNEAKASLDTANARVPRSQRVGGPGSGDYQIMAESRRRQTIGGTGSGDMGPLATDELMAEFRRGLDRQAALHAAKPSRSGKSRKTKAAANAPEEHLGKGNEAGVVGEISGGIANPPVYLGGGKSSKSKVDSGKVDTASIDSLVGPPKNAKIGAMTPDQMDAAFTAAHKMPKGSARTRKLNALNAEKTRRVAAVKALGRQHYEARKFVSSKWPDGKQPLQVHNSFFKKLLKIMPALRSRLSKMRDENGRVKGMRVLLTTLDQLVRDLSGQLIGSALAVVGLHFLVK